MEVEIVNVGYAYRGYKELFKNVSFRIRSGEIICILGPNGIGKTTLLNCMANLDIPSKGKILIEGRNMNEMSPQEVARVISFVPQTIAPSFDYKVIDYVVTGCAPRIGIFQRPKKEDYIIAENAIEQMKIGHLREKEYTKISGGERQQVSIARAIAQQPEIILMDEPTAHLDYGNQVKVLRVIKDMAKRGYGVAFTTHSPDQALLLKCKVAVFNEIGEFFFGDYKDVLTEDFLRSMYGVDLHLYNIEDMDRRVCIVSKF